MLHVSSRAEEGLDKLMMINNIVVVDISVIIEYQRN